MKNLYDTWFADLYIHFLVNGFSANQKMNKIVITSIYNECVYYEHYYIDNNKGEIQLKRISMFDR